MTSAPSTWSSRVKPLSKDNRYPSFKLRLGDTDKEWRKIEITDNTLWNASRQSVSQSHNQRVSLFIRWDLRSSMIVSRWQKFLVYRSLGSSMKKYIVLSNRTPVNYLTHWEKMNITCSTFPISHRGRRRRTILNESITSITTRRQMNKQTSNWNRMRVGMMKQESEDRWWPQGQQQTDDEIEKVTRKDTLPTTGCRAIQWIKWWKRSYCLLNISILRRHAVTRSLFVEIIAWKITLS